MNFIYGKNSSFGSLFQYDENVITAPKKVKDCKTNKAEESKKNKIDKTKIKNDSKLCLKEKSALDQEIDSNPFFFT